jgi:hypothetical protein
MEKKEAFIYARETMAMIENRAEYIYVIVNV